MSTATDTIPLEKSSFAEALAAAAPYFTERAPLGAPMMGAAPDATPPPATEPSPAPTAATAHLDRLLRRPAAATAAGASTSTSTITSTPAIPPSLPPSVSPSSDPAAPATHTSATTPALDDIDRDLQPPPETSRSRTGWDELKKRATEHRDARAAAEKRLADLEARLAASPEAAADAATRARLGQLEQENKTYAERLKALDLRASPEFAAKYLAPQQAARAALAEIVRQDELPSADLDAIFSLKGKAFNQAVSGILEELTPYARAKFQGQLDTYLQAQLGAETAAAEADEFLRTAREANRARARAAFDQTAHTYREHFLPLDPAAQPDDPARQHAETYNTALAAVTRRAESYAFGALDERTAADLAHKAALYEFTMAHALPRIRSIVDTELASKSARIDQLESRIRALTTASPTVQSAAGTPTPASTPNESHLEAARRYTWSVQG